MPHVELTAAPSGAALPSTVVPDGQAAHAAGFAAVLAGAQSAATGDDPSLKATSDTRADDIPMSPGRTRGDTQMNAWLVLSRLALQLTGTASTAVAAAAEPKKPLNTAPADDAGATATEESGTGTSPVESVTALLASLLTSPTAKPAAEPADIVGDAAAPAPDGSLKAIGSAESEQASPSPSELAAPVEVETGRGAPLLPEQAIPADAAPVPSIRELLAELKKAAAPLTPSSDHGAAPAHVAATSLTEPGAAPAPASSGEAAGQDGRDRRGGLSAKTAAFGDRRQPVLDDRTTAMARTLAARFQAGEATATAGEPAAMGGTAALAAPRATPAAVDLPRGAVKASEAFNAGAFAAMGPGFTAASASGLATAAVTAAAPLTPAAIVGDTATGLHSQIVQAMRVQMNGTGGDAQIRLQPHFLGDLTISLKVENGGVTAQLAASSQDVRQWIESNEQMLRQSLAQHDLRLDKLVVLEEESAPSRREDGDRQPDGHGQEQRRPRRRPEADSATFEVVV